MLSDAPPNTATTTKEELLHFYREMYTVRRMEIACDTEYKARTIRGFCHLYDGQEGVGMGLQAGLSKDDHVATSYRCHGLQYFRGTPVRAIVGELFGFEQGCSKGKGGSMHLYSKANRFWGGAGIVGAQIPIAGGLAFKEKYIAGGKAPMNVAVGMYGDGAANQGQVWETANMAKLWSLPLILLCENNQYGMGTATNRHSCNDKYYTQGGVVIPGVQCDGLDVLAMREAVKFCRAHASSGKGPIFLEAKTYRYHGHSMSDPGITYRNREEVAEMRNNKDCIDQVKARLIEAGWATEASMKDVEKEIRQKVRTWRPRVFSASAHCAAAYQLRERPHPPPSPAQVSEEVEAARKGSLPREELLYSDILFNEVPQYIRLPNRVESKARA